MHMYLKMYQHLLFSLFSKSTPYNDVIATYRKLANTTRGTIKSCRFLEPILLSKIRSFTICAGYIQERVVFASLRYMNIFILAKVGHTDWLTKIKTKEEKGKPLQRTSARTSSLITKFKFKLDSKFFNFYWVDVSLITNHWAHWVFRFWVAHSSTTKTQHRSSIVCDLFSSFLKLLCQQPHFCFRLNRSGY